MNLLIVESPIQARRIISFLPEGWRVEASRGHLRDLPIGTLGVDLTHDFALQYQITPDHFGTLNRLKEAARAAEAVYLGTAPDREGEAIAAHLAELLKEAVKNKPLHRVTFSAVTATAIRDALERPRQIDPRLVEAQQTRRTLDRLVGYLLSPLASRVLKAPHSIGRVQMAALWLLAARDVDGKMFKAHPYWTLDAHFKSEAGIEFTAQLSTVHNRRAEGWNSQTVQTLAAGLQHGCAYVHEVTTQTETRPPAPPFTTATLLQVACERLHLTPDRVMVLAHALYEQGLITHPRTASVAVSPEAQGDARMFIKQSFGEAYLSVLPQIYTGKSSEAHEAIYPTDVTCSPEGLLPGEWHSLYALIWRRFILSQMADAQVQMQTATLQMGKDSGQRFDVFFTTHAEQCTFDGFHKLSGDALEADPSLTTLVVGQVLHATAATPTQHRTQPPQPFTDSTLIAALEQHGVGRPATYASTLKLLIDKGYLARDGATLMLTAHAKSLCAFLARHFPEPFVADFTVNLERQLDQIASGETTRLDVLHEFWMTFMRSYQPLAAVFVPDKTTPLSDMPIVLGVCPKCGGKLVARRTKTGGQFAGCEHFPKCDGRAAPVLLSAVKGAVKAGQ